MANELRHKDAVSGRVREDEFEHIRQHILNDQATGDLVYASSATQLSGLAVGADNYILSVATDTPAWISPASLLADISPLTTRGDIMFRNATISTRLAKGAANTVLVMGADDPAWSATLAGLTLTSPTINGTIATTGLTLPAITLGGAVAGGDQAFTGVGDMTFTDGSIIAAIDGAGTTLLLKSGGVSGTTFITLTSQSGGTDTMILGKTFFYDAGGEYIESNGTNLTIAGGVIFPGTLYLYDAGGESLSSNGSVLTIAGAVTFSGSTIITADSATIEIGAAGVIKSGSTNTDTLLLAANDTTFITLLTGATDVCTMNAITASGTWLASGTWTIPAITLSGSITGASQTMTGMGTINGLAITADTGAITAGSWTATVISPVYGGTGVANNVASTITISGSYGLTLTVSNITALTLPTTGTLATLAGTEELDNKTLDSSVAKGTWTASGTWTIPAVTLGGTLNAAGYTITGLGGLTVGAGAMLSSAVDDNYFLILGGSGVNGKGSYVLFSGANLGGYTGSIILATPNAAGDADISRLNITGKTAEAVATWGSTTHTDFNLSDYLGLFKTDTDSAVEAELWYDDSENVLKYYTGAAVKTVAVVAGLTLPPEERIDTLGHKFEVGDIVNLVVDEILPSGKFHAIPYYGGRLN